MKEPAGTPWQPGPSDYEAVFRDQNPWHALGTVPQALAFDVERPLAAALWRRMTNDHPRRFQLILGPRRVGKTTCLFQTIRRLIENGVPAMRIWWFRLDHPLLLEVRLNELVRRVLKLTNATDAEPAYVFFDELTYARDWDLWLKAFYDERWPVRIAGSSSATAVIRGRQAESGVGRWQDQYLSPYLFPEYLALAGSQPTLEVAAALAETISASLLAVLPDVSEARRFYTLIGGFPELLLDSRLRGHDLEFSVLHSQRTLRADAVERALYKDIPQAFGVDSPLLLERLLYTLAGQFTGILSPARTCERLPGITQPTLDRYLSYLSRSYLIFLLPNYSGSEASTQRRGRKLYFVDGAVRNAALHRGIAPMNDPVELGMLLENLVAGHLYTLSQRTGVRLFHWRDGKHEVDLIYDHPTEPLALEVASSARHSRDGIHKFIARFPRFRGRCYLVAPNALATPPHETRDGVGLLPVDLLLLAAGAQAERALANSLSTGADDAM